MEDARIAVNRRRRLEFGTGPGSDIASSSPAIEAAGFDYLVIGEHLLFHGDMKSGLLSLAAATSVTTSIRLVSGVVIAPLYPAAMLAWLAMSLDHLSNGRFELGIGLGGEFPKEFEAVGVDPRERGRRTDEALEVMRRLWEEDDVSHRGRFNQFEHVNLRPKPIQSRLPIWIAGRREGAMARAARFGDGWMPYMYSPERLSESIRIVRTRAEGAGRNPRSIRPAIYASATIYEDSAKAKRIAGELVSAGYQQDLRRIVDRYLIAGSPNECRARLREYSDAGAEVAFLPLSCPPEDRAEMMRLLVSEVMPEFNSHAHDAPSSN